MSDTRKGRVLLVHWHAEECGNLAVPLRAAGWDVTALSEAGGIRMKELRAAEPTVVVISLRRLPSHGREVARALRASRWGQSLPLVFLDGTTEKVEAMRTTYPNALFATGEDLTGCLESLLQQGGP